MSQFFRLGLMLVVAAVAGCGKNGNDTVTIDGSTRVTATQPNGDVTTVNGAISIDEKARLGAAKTENGDIYMSAGADAASLGTVNGASTIDKGARGAGEVTAVNGTISMLDGSEVAGSLTNVNGRIIVTDAHLAGGITTVGGDVSVNGNARIDAGIWVKNLNMGVLPAGERVPRVVIGPGATVRGELRFEHKVKLFVSDKATVGSISGAEPVKYSGDTPPP